MAKAKMTIAEALNNHAVIEKLYILAPEGTYTYDYMTLTDWIIYEENNLGIKQTIESFTPETICEVELIDSEAIEIKIAELQKRLEQLNAIKALHEVAE